MAASSGQRIYYGWIVVAACFVAMLCFGEVYWSFGVFFNELEQEFGWSRGLTSSGYTFLIVGYALSAMAAGRLTDRYSARPVFLAGALLAGPAISLCSQVHTLTQLQLLLFVTGLGSGVFLSAPAATVQKWFHNRRHSAVALSAVMAGSGVGALVFAPLVNRLIAVLGWREAFVVAGAIFFVGVIVAAFLVRPLPRGAAAGLSAGMATRLRSMRIRDLIRTPQFLQISFIMAVSVLGFQVLSVHLVPYATDAGFSSAAAAAALGLAGGFSTVGRMLSGVLSERIGWAGTLSLAELGVGIAMFLPLFIDRDWMLYGFVLLYGVCLGMRTVSVMGVIGHVFGIAFLGELIGVNMAVSQLLGALGPYAAGHMHDALGSYRLVFTILGVLLLICAVLALRLKGRPYVELGEAAASDTAP